MSCSAKNNFLSKFPENRLSAIYDSLFIFPLDARGKDNETLFRNCLKNNLEAAVCYGKSKL